MTSAVEMSATPAEPVKSSSLHSTDMRNQCGRLRRLDSSGVSLVQTSSETWEKVSPVMGFTSPSEETTEAVRKRKVRRVLCLLLAFASRGFHRPVADSQPGGSVFCDFTLRKPR